MMDICKGIAGLAGLRKALEVFFGGLFQKKSPPAGGPWSQIGLAGAETAQNIINAYPGKGDNRALFSGKPRPV